MSARLAAAFTTCQTVFGVIPVPQILSSRLTRRKIAPFLMPAAIIHSSTARFAQMGTPVRMCFSFANQVSNDVMLLANLEIFHSESDQFGGVSRIQSAVPESLDHVCLGGCLTVILEASSWTGR